MPPAGESPAYRPNGRERTLEIAAEDQFDIRIAVLAAKQTFRQVKHPLRVVQALDVDFFAESIAALVACAQLLVFFGRHLVVALEVRVAAHAKVFYANQSCHVVEMIEGVFDGGGLIDLDEHAHPGDAHDSAGCRHFLDGSLL